MHQDKGSGSHMVILILWQMLLAAFKRIHIMLENAEKEDRSEILFTWPVGYPPSSLFLEKCNKYNVFSSNFLSQKNSDAHFDIKLLMG